MRINLTASSTSFQHITEKPCDLANMNLLNCVVGDRPIYEELRARIPKVLADLDFVQWKECLRLAAHLANRTDGHLGEAVRMVVIQQRGARHRIYNALGTLAEFGGGSIQHEAKPNSSVPI